MDVLSGLTLTHMLVECVGNTARQQVAHLLHYVHTRWMLYPTPTTLHSLALSATLRYVVLSVGVQLSLFPLFISHVSADASVVMVNVGVVQLLGQLLVVVLLLS
jgi:hypothetical protein